MDVWYNALTNELMLVDARDYRWHDFILQCHWIFFIGVL